MKLVLLISATNVALDCFPFLLSFFTRFKPKNQISFNFNSVVILVNKSFPFICIDGKLLFRLNNFPDWTELFVDFWPIMSSIEVLYGFDRSLGVFYLIWAEWKVVYWWLPTTYTRIFPEWRVIKFVLPDLSCRMLCLWDNDNNNLIKYSK